MIDKIMYFIIGGLDRWIKWINDKFIIKPKKKKKSKPSQEDLFNGS